MALRINSLFLFAALILLVFLFAKSTARPQAMAPSPSEDDDDMEVIKNVEKNKEVQDLGRFAVEQINKQVSYSEQLAFCGVAKAKRWHGLYGWDYFFVIKSEKVEEKIEGSLFCATLSLFEFVPSTMSPSFSSECRVLCKFFVVVRVRSFDDDGGNNRSSLVVKVTFSLSLQSVLGGSLPSPGSGEKGRGAVLYRRKEEGSLPSPRSGEKGRVAVLCRRKEEWFSVEGRVVRFSAGGRKSGSLPSPRSGEKGQGGEALTKKSFFLFHPYTVMAENPSSFLRQRTATLPFSPLLGDGREPSSFLRQRTATLPFSPLLGDGREPSSFLRQRTATLPFSPLLGEGREPWQALTGVFTQDSRDDGQ
ncbi:hypothetical protein M5K25_024435 [Dendrobium thyrsiflorum]|uniref:Uncharacterized protein n=1 Tax=Dendrobium thyrsiflorum TaxID=117978 RepID=A0ABD0U2B1_DENTH